MKGKNIKTPAEESHRIFQHGIRFEKAAMLLMDCGFYGRPEVVLPAYTNAGISIELYLKALLNHEKGGFPQTHDLVDLFTSLDPSTQHTILLKFNQLVKISDKKKIEDIETASKVKFSKDFFTNLKELSRTIVEMRYYFDMDYSKGLVMFFIDEIRQAVRLVADPIFEKKRL